MIRGFTITPAIVDQYQKNLDNNKSMEQLKLYLTHCKQAPKFETPALVPQFLQVVKKANVSKELYIKTIELFRTSVGLPTKSFDSNIQIVARDMTSPILFSKELLERSFPYFAAMFRNNWKESAHRVVEPTMSEEALEAFKKYVYTAKIGSVSINGLLELVTFADKIMDTTLQDLVSEAIVSYYLDEKNEASFDDTPLKEHAKEFTKKYLEKKEIPFSILESGSYSIPISCFLALFAKESKLLDFIAKEIDQLSIDTGDISGLFLLRQKYRRAIISIAEDASTYTTSFDDWEILQASFLHVSSLKLETNPTRAKDIIDKNIYEPVCLASP